MTWKDGGGTTGFNEAEAIKPRNQSKTLKGIFSTLKELQ